MYYPQNQYSIGRSVIWWKSSTTQIFVAIRTDYLHGTACLNILVLQKPTWLDLGIDSIYSTLEIFVLSGHCPWQNHVDTSWIKLAVGLATFSQGQKVVFIQWTKDRGPLLNQKRCRLNRWPRCEIKAARHVPRYGQSWDGSSTRAVIDAFHVIP